MEAIHDEWRSIQALIEADEDDAAEAALISLLGGLPSPPGPQGALYAQAGLALIELLVAQGDCSGATAWVRRLVPTLSANPALRLPVARIEWAEFSDSEAERDTVQQVDALRACEQFLARYGGSDEPIELRRLYAEAALKRASWLSDLQGESEALEAYLALAEGLSGTGDAALRQTRLHALYLAAVTTDDAQQTVDLLDVYLKEWADDPAHQRSAGSAATPMRAHCQRLEALGRLDRDSAELAAQGREVLDAYFQRSGAMQPDLRTLGACHALSLEVCSLYRASSDAQAADAVMLRLLAHFSVAHQAQIRARMATVFLQWVDADAPDAVRYSDWECAQWQTLLQHYATEADPQVLQSLAPAWWRLGRAQTELRRPHEGEATLAAFIARMESSADPNTAEQVARASLDRAIALTDTGRGDEARAVYAAMRQQPVTGQTTTRHRACIAEAGYWFGRDLREQGHAAQSAQEIEALLDRFATDPDAQVRLHAANALYSEWQTALAQDPTRPDREAHALAAMQRFAQLFGADDGIAIQRLDAKRRLRLGGVVAQRGQVEEAAVEYRALIDRYAASGDIELRETLVAARENLSVLALKGASEAVTGIQRDPAYARLRAQVEQADALSSKGQLEQAASLYREAATQALANADAQVRLLGVVALSQWAADLLNSKQWGMLAQVAQQVIDHTADTLARPPEVETRTLRLRSISMLRLGIALNRLGDRQSAIAAYALLADFIGAQRDDDEEISSNVATGLFNRAVLIDESGDMPAAILAYERLVTYQRDMLQPPGVQLREVKALRNKTLALTAEGRHAEAADACRRVLDLCAAHATEDFTQRARAAAVELAAAQRAQRLWDEAARTYEWVLSDQGPAFPPREAADIRRLLKEVSRVRKPWWRLW